jgi:hypothetical protein
MRPSPTDILFESKELSNTFDEYNLFLVFKVFGVQNPFAKGFWWGAGVNPLLALPPHEYTCRGWDIL